MTNVLLYKVLDFNIILIHGIDGARHGVSLGQPSTIYFQPGNAKQKKKGVPTAEQQSILSVRVKEYPKSDSFAIEVTLPRRSIYVMSGASRIE